MSCFERELCDGWQIAVDSANIGKTAGWADAVRPEAVPARVPGWICDFLPDFKRGVAWYWNTFDLPDVPDPDCEYCIKAGYTEWLAEYWLNGVYVGSFAGMQLNYELDLTPAVREKDNLLAVRIVSPTPEGIDGWSFGGAVTADGKPIPRNFITSARGMGSDYGGILYPIVVAARPRLRAGRLVVKSDFRTGGFSVSAELHNHTDIPRKVSLSLQLLSQSGERAWSSENCLTLGCGDGQTEFSGTLEAFHPWDVVSPYLYTALVTVSADGQVIHTARTRFGFRDFRVKDGFFCLNDRRIFLKCANTTMVTPPWLNRPWDHQCLRDEMLREKAMGHNAIRYLHGNIWPEILDLCDEIGLMVFEEHAASWEQVENNPNFARQFLFHARGVLHRDINHPSFTMFGLLNECTIRPYFDAAADTLGALREEDDSRLFLLNSGRFDGQYQLGSVSNPGSRSWDCVWGAEAPTEAEYPFCKVAQYGREDLTRYGGVWGCREDELTCWAPEQGDMHYYPRLPMSRRSVDILRTHCAGLKPSFISEGSHNSMGNPFSMLRRAEQAGCDVREVLYRLERIREKRLKEDFVRFGMDELFGVPEDMVYESYALNAKQRRFFFDCVRSNPQIAGLCYTMATDYSGAGIIPPERDRYKPYLLDAISACFAPLHWCIFVNPTHVYRHRPFTVEAVLASEDALLPGSYPITAKLVSREYGKAWEYHTTLTIPEPSDAAPVPLSFPVFRETVTADLPEGNYELTVYMEKGGSPSGGRLTVPVTEHRPLEDASAAMLGLPERVKCWLLENGVAEKDDSDLLLIGTVPEEDAAWDALYERVKAGASAVFLLPETLLKGVKDPFDYNVYVPERLPFPDKGKLTFADNWHYHCYGAVKPHPYTEGLQKGLMDNDYYMLAEPQFVFFDGKMPDEIAAVSMACPYYTHSTEGTSGYLFGTTLGVYRYGKGRLVLSGMKLFDAYGDSPTHENLGKNPAADRVLLNIISHESAQLK